MASMLDTLYLNLNSALVADSGLLALEKILATLGESNFPDFFDSRFSEISSRLRIAQDENRSDFLKSGLRSMKTARSLVSQFSLSNGKRPDLVPQVISEATSAWLSFDDAGTPAVDAMCVSAYFIALSYLEIGKTPEVLRPVTQRVFPQAVRIIEEEVTTVSTWSDGRFSEIKHRTYWGQDGEIVALRYFYAFEGQEYFSVTEYADGRNSGAQLQVRAARDAHLKQERSTILTLLRGASESGTAFTTWSKKHT